METLKLELDFTDDIGKNFRLNVDNPIDNIGKEVINTAARTIMDNNIFTLKGESLVDLKRARKIRTIIEDIGL